MTIASSSGLLPAIFGLEGTELTLREFALFRKTRPVGYIVFARNCDTPEQLTQLTDSLHALHEDYTPLILIDQEGGRVARLREPHWHTPPAPASYADMLKQCSLEKACDAARTGSATIARTLKEHGINVNCTPMCDVRAPSSHDIIGDRAYGETAEQVISFARAVADGLADEGVLPIIKHIPGHGRALCDSHEDLPIVDASLEELQSDFAPFQALKHLPLAMTAHIIYSAIDAERPATLSPTVIKLIREEIGFTNLLMSDDVCMKALSGSMADIAIATLDAGCDIVLHCNGALSEMEAIADAIASYPTIEPSAINALFAA